MSEEIYKEYRGKFYTVGYAPVRQGKNVKWKWQAQVMVKDWVGVGYTSGGAKRAEEMARNYIDRLLDLPQPVPTAAPAPKRRKRSPGTKSIRKLLL